MKRKLIGATEFKARCLSLLDNLHEQGGEIIVTKRGRPVATVQPVKTGRVKSSRDILKGKIHPKGDLVNFDTSHLWEALRKD